MGITEEGIEGEQKLFSFIASKNVDFFQADAIGFNKGRYEIYEVKHQCRFTPPPYEGHGLPPKQVEARLRFQEKTGIRCVFVVFDKETNEIFYQYLDVLERGEHFDTKGSKVRRIYKLTNFIKANI